jgi:hypothetical protein
LLDILSPEDFNRRERYSNSVDPKSTKLIAVLAPYRFKDKVHCGLTSCRTPHNFGYLISTEDDRETNIGNDCGRKHFGKDFTIQRNIEEKKRRRLLQLETLKNIYANKEQLVQRIGVVKSRPYGISWLMRSRKALQQEITSQFYFDLNSKARRGEASVSDTRERSEKEIKRLQDMNPGTKRDKWRYETSHAGTLVGLQGFAFDFTNVFLVGLEQKLQTLLQSDIDNLPGKALGTWVSWANGIENVFQQTEDALSDAIRFFQRQNFELFPYLTTDNKLKKKLETLAWDVEKGAPAKTWP